MSVNTECTPVSSDEFEDACDVFDVTVRMLCLVMTCPEDAYPGHDLWCEASCGTDSETLVGCMAVAAGLIGLGKLMSVCSSPCPPDAIGGCTMADGYDTCISL